MLQLQDFRVCFLHYILNAFWAVGQGEAEVLEEDGEAGFGAVDQAEAQVLAGAGGQDNVHGMNLGHLFEEFSGGGPEAAR